MGTKRERMVQWLGSEVQHGKNAAWGAASYVLPPSSPIFLGSILEYNKFWESQFFSLAMESDVARGNFYPISFAAYAHVQMAKNNAEFGGEKCRSVLAPAAAICTAGLQNYDSQKAFHSDTLLALAMCVIGASNEAGGRDKQ